MSDRELLELAAKAAGVKIDKSTSNGGGVGNTGFDTSGNAVLDWHNGTTWNPLTNDGDALRLAVKISQKKPLRLMLPEFNDAWAVFDDYTHDFKIREFNEADHMAATRRAIVRAAAEIGKGMP